MQVAEYSRFSGLVHEKYLGKRAPVEVSIEVTHRCPLECLHCYNNLPMADVEARSSEMTLAEHCRLLDELRDAGCLWVLYTGGEIFARKDFPDIYKEAKKRGFLVTLFTNGTLITPAVADMLAEWRPFAIEITLYGATQETYEALTQIPGSFERCMRGIRLLQERNLPLKLKTVPTSVNRHEVYEMKRLAEEEFGVEFKFDPLVNPRIDCSASPLGVRLSPEEVVALDYHDPKRRAEYGRLAAHDLAEGAGAERDTDHVYSCGGGISACAVDPTGKMSICVISHQDTYDWRSGSFQDSCGRRAPRSGHGKHAATAAGFSPFAACVRLTANWRWATLSLPSTSCAKWLTCALTRWAWKFRSTAIVPCARAARDIRKPWNPRNELRITRLTSGPGCHAPPIRLCFQFCNRKKGAARALVAPAVRITGK